MGAGCVALAGCLLKAPVSEQGAANMLYLKAMSLQSDAEYNEAVAGFKQFVATFPKSD